MKMICKSDDIALTGIIEDNPTKTVEQQVAVTKPNLAHKRRNTLRELRTGDTAQVVGFTFRDQAIQKIEAMGVRKGKRLTVLKKLGRGMLIKVGSTRIVITMDVAKNIEVK
jgi:ferrous iron transport protein A